MRCLRHLMSITLLAGWLGFSSWGCSPGLGESRSYVVQQAYPHDPTAFTQGLAFSDGHLFEATGLYGASTLRVIEVETGIIRQEIAFAKRLFAEGVTVVGNRLIQLFWNSDTALVLDKGSLALMRTVAYGRRGWGITYNGENVIVSDGTDTLHFLDPETFVEIGRLPVLDRGVPVVGLNELEFVQSRIFANVYPTSRIAAISPQTGHVVFWIDLDGMLSDDDRRRFAVSVSNGIAYDSVTDRLLVTGKLWPKLIELRLKADQP